MKKYFIIILIIIFISYAVIEHVSRLSTESSEIDIKNIYFGQTLDLEHNLTSLQYFKGFELAFQSVNRINGIKGYKVNIVLLNDKYEKNMAISNANLLVDYYNVLALIGTFGTPTTVGVIENIIDKKNVPLIGPFTGSLLIRSKFNKNLIITSGSLLEEYNLVFKMFKKLNIVNIGIIYQNDDYGISYLNGFINSAISKKIPINILSVASYERNSQFLYDTYKKLFSIDKPYLINQQASVKEIQAVILVVAESQLSNILGSLKKINPSLYIFYNFFVGTNKSNYNLIKENNVNVYQTLLSHNVKNDYPELYKKLVEEVDYYNNFNHSSEYKNINKIEDYTNTLYQGFYTGLMIVEVLKSFEDPGKVTRQQFINKFYEIKNFNIFGLKLGPFELNKSNIGSNYASLNKISNNELELVFDNSAKNTDVEAELKLNKLTNQELTNQELSASIKSNTIYIR